MRNLSSILILASLLAFTACQSGNQTDAEEAPPLPNNQVDIPASWSALFNPNSGVFRGVDFTMTQEQVATAESAEKVSEAAGSATYTLDLNENEFADIHYSFADGNLQKMQVDVFSSDAASAEAAGEELTNLFNAKYQSRSNLWDGSEKGVNFTAFVKVFDSEENPGMTIVWERMQN